MAKYLLSVGLLLGALTTIGTAGPTGVERELANQAKASTLDQEDFRIGDPVWVYLANQKQWLPGTILGIASNNNTIIRVRLDIVRPREIVVHAQSLRHR